MTTTDVASRSETQPNRTLPAGIIRVFQSVVFMRGNDGALPQDQYAPRWFEPTIRRMAGLPWDDDNWNDDAKPTQPNAAALLLATLAKILDDDSPGPIIVPTWRGGVQAEWHQNGVDLEIEADPDGSVEYYFEDAAEEYEGPVTTDNLSQLIRQARGLSSHTG